MKSLTTILLISILSFIFIASFSLASEETLVGTPSPTTPLKRHNTKTTFIRVERKWKTNKSTIGKLLINGQDVGLYTLELPWKNNAPFQSCIPTGTYTMNFRSASESSALDYNHVIVNNVPNRTYILFHKGCCPNQTEGCLIVGNSRSTDYVGGTDQAFSTFMNLLQGSTSMYVTVVDHS